MRTDFATWSNRNAIVQAIVLVIIAREASGGFVMLLKLVDAFTNAFRKSPIHLQML